MSEPIPCLLCKVRRFTKRYHEDRLFWIVDCLQCGKPIIVSRSHVENISERKRKKALELIKSVFSESAKFGVGMKLIKGHWHEHIC